VPEDEIMPKVKIDIQGIKQFLVERGERVGLGVAGGIMVLFLLLGTLAALRSSSPDKTIESATKDLEGKIARQSTDEKDPTAPRPPDWDPLRDLFRFAGVSWLLPGQSGDAKRRNPDILPVARMVKDHLIDIQMDVVTRPVKFYELHFEIGKVAVFKEARPGGPAAAGGAFTPSREAGGSAAVFGQGGFQAQSGAKSIVERVSAQRMVVVSAAFPYREQLELFRKALRKESVSELFTDPKDRLAPRIKGLIVFRAEIFGPGKASDWVPIYTVDAKGRAVVSDKAPLTKRLLKTAVYDEDNPAKLANFMMPGFVTPLPLLAKDHDYYPPPKMEDLAVKEDLVKREDDAKGPGPFFPGGMKSPGSAMPGTGSKMPGLGNPKGKQPGSGGVMPGTVGATPTADLQTKEIKWQELPPGQKETIGRRFNDERLIVFDPYGQPPGKHAGNASAFGPAMPKPGSDATQPPKKDEEPKDDPDDDDQPAPARPGTPGPGGMVFGADFGSGKPDRSGTADFAGPEYCLVRFVDADVQPGKTYQYLIKVRVANPNYKKPNVVIFKALADVPELYSPWTQTPTVTVPREWDFYVVDEWAVEPWTKKVKVKGTDDRPITGSSYARERTAVQIHKWMEKFLDPGPVAYRDLGDWLVQERRVVYRGEPVVTADDVDVEVPGWNEAHQRFELIAGTGSKKGPKGVKVKFTPPSGDPPLVVDFTGGEKITYPVTSRQSQDDTSAVELLLLSPEGKLFLRSSRLDAYPDTPRGQARVDHWQHWRERIFRLKGWGGEKKESNPKGTP
jgi:hypothetical protein